MALPTDHLAQKAANETLHNWLTANTIPGLPAHVREQWAVIVLFYAAVQHIQAALANTGVAVVGHGQRAYQLRSRWPQAEASYWDLKQISDDYRYEAHSPSATELLDAEDDYQEICRWVP